MNLTRVQSTNDASTISKCSAVSKKYFRDDFIDHFVDNKKRRTSIVNLGYYTRAVIMEKLIKNYIEYFHKQGIPKFQIISCGAGFDTLFWRLSQANLIDNVVLVEIDLPEVVKRKMALINQSDKLKSVMSEIKCISNRIYQLNSSYFLLDADLRNVDGLLHDFSVMKLDQNANTLLLSECVITYLESDYSSKLIQKIAKKFRNSTFINYEQIHPYDSFGRIMVRHFENLESPLITVHKYPNCETHRSRFKKEFESSIAVSEWEAFFQLTTELIRKTAFCLELFDEFEEFHSKCAHYVLSIYGNGVGASWMKLLPFYQINSINCMRDSWIWKPINVNLQRYRNFSCNFKGNVLVFGGSNFQKRCSEVFRIKSISTIDLEAVECLDCSLVELDIIQGKAVAFALDNITYVCLYGGRNAPNKISNNGGAVVLEVTESDKLQLKLVTIEKPSIGRYRTSMVLLNSTKDKAKLYIFGGRTTDLNVPLSDLWELTFEHNFEGELAYVWKQHKQKDNNWPCARMSHSAVACPNRQSFILSCGLSFDSFSALNDVWEWNYEAEIWHKHCVSGILLPRYGHTSHFHNNVLYLIGGVNHLDGRQPGVASIDMTNLIVTEYDVEVKSEIPFLLFNHTSEIVEHENDTCILVLGGGGNCFSFGTHVNEFMIYTKLNS